MDKTKAKEIQWVGSQEMQGLIYKEIFEEMVYEKFFEVEEGDIVLDIGASFGPFTHSILPKKPKQVYCVEPGETQFPVLVKNTFGHPVCSINKGIWHTNERVSSDRVYDSINQSMDGITFKKLVQLYGLDKIDFLKTDCEGGEYFIFNEENFEFIQNNVRKIVGEWHLGPPDLKERFRKFRDLYLAKIENYRVFSVNGMDIKWDLWNEHFLEYYSEIIIYIDNRKKAKRPFSELLREKHSKLDYRLETFAKAFDYLESLKQDYYVIVETGTVRTFGEYEDGQSTILFDEFVNYHDGVVYTVDTDPKCKEIVTEHCSKKVKAYTGDSVEFLRNHLGTTFRKIDLLYLDSMDIDWDNPTESMEHHFKEFSSVLPSLKDKCLILSDDNALKKPVGKGMLVDTYFKNAGVERFIDGFQLGWIFKATVPEVENKSILLMGHASYIGHTGYNEHTRNFFRKLNNFYPVKVRNFAYIHDQSYLDELDHKILMEQTWAEPPYKAGSPCKFDKEEVIDIVLAETNHYYFHDDYKDHRKIAYNVWESTLYPEEFFKKLFEYDQLWVPSEWAKNCAVKQGFPEDRVKVVPEGVDGTIFYPATEVTKLPSEYNDGRFKFLLFGRWDSRKSITEIIQTFLKTFDKSEPVDLVVSIDNPFPEPDQKGKTTEQYLKYLGLDDPRIHVKHFPPLEEYISYLQHGHVFISCSRSEGWNLPCFTGDTKISLLNGEEKEIKDLVNEKEFWVYAYDANTKSIVPAKGHSCKLTRKASKILKIILDNNEIIRCTPDHLFLLRNGKYVKACNLQPEASLMPLYRRVSKFNRRDKKKCISSIKDYKYGYEEVFQPNGYWELTHRLVGKYKYGNRYEKSVFHHKDFNSRNNEPKNLLLIDGKKHWKYHSNHIKKITDKMLLDGTHPFKNQNSYPNMRPEKKSARVKELAKFGKHNFQDEEFRKKQLERINDLAAKGEWISQTDEFRSKAKERLIRRNKEYAKLGKHSSQIMKAEPPRYSCKYCGRIDFSSHLALCGHMAWCSISESRKKEILAKRSKETSERNLKFVSEGKHIFQIMKERVNGFSLVPKRGCKYCGKNFKSNSLLYNHERECRKFINHKVISVEIDGYEDVYDFTVDNYHNFSLSSGVFVHNCIQAIACGIPTICSEYGAQLDFAKGVSHMVRIKEMRPIKYMFLYDNPPPGEFSEPDFDHLSEVMRELHDNYPKYTEKAVKDAYEVIEKFKWENAAKIAAKLIDELPPRIKPPESITVNYHFVKKPFINIVGNSPDTFKVSFIDKSKNEQERSRIVFSLDLKCGHWAAANRQWFTDWRLQVEKGKEVIFTHDLDFKNKRVFINLDSKSLGDTIAWFPYIEEFRKKHGCTVIAATFWNSLFADNYPELTFVEPGVRVDNLYAQYSLSYEFYNDFDRNPIPCKQVTLQQVATNHLGLDYVEVKPKIKVPPLWDGFHKDMDKFLMKSSKKQYVCIAEHSTSMCKYWNYPKGWQKVVDYLKNLGYAVVALGKENTYLTDTWKRTGIPIEKTLAYLANASFFIGMGSGLAWLAWAIDIPTIMISGCSEKYCEFKETEKNIRIINEDVCHGCLNDMDWEFDKSDWYYCPSGKDFECTRSIPPETVFKAIDNLI